MDAIISAFGIDGRLIIIQLVNFVILMGALGYFLYTPILNALKAREEKIAQGIADAEAAAVARAGAETEKGAILTAAHATAEEISSRAKATATEQAEVIVSDAEAKATHLLKNAEAAAEQLRAKVQKEAEAEIAKTAVLAAEKVLRERAT
jgi:F-type H+-transporting ATPase subunit b